MQTQTAQTRLEVSHKRKFRLYAKQRHDDIREDGQKDHDHVDVRKNCEILSSVCIW